MNRSARALFRVFRINRLLLAAALIVVLALLLLPGRGFMPAAGYSPAERGSVARAVAQGVTLRGRDFSGRTEAEARAMLMEMESGLTARAVGALESRDADGISYIIPEVNGAYLDMDTTWFRLSVAAQGTRVEPATRVQEPPLRLADYPLSVIRQANPEKQMVVLLINVDWGERELVPMLATLKKHGTRASFFVSGRWAAQNRELLRLIATDGHEIASHGYNLTSGPAALERAGKLRDDIERSVNTIEGITGARIRYWAPHMSEVNPQIVRTAADLKLRTVLYTVDTVDWHPSSTPDLILGRMLKAKAGDLILLHPKPNTAEVLDRAITELKKRGLQPVTLSEAVSPDPVAPAGQEDDHQ